MKKALATIFASQLLYSLLAVSILFFLIKGVIYAGIGSYVPLIFIGVMTALLSWSLSLSPKAHRRVLRFWAILITVWALARFSVWLMLNIDTNLTESHLREQFGLFQHIISTIILGIGIMILIQIKKQKEGQAMTKASQDA